MTKRTRKERFSREQKAWIAHAHLAWGNAKAAAETRAIVRRLQVTSRKRGTPNV